MPEAHEDLILYKRHTPDCAVHKTRIPPDKQKYWMDCQCPIWIVGRVPNGDIYPRQSTKLRDEGAAIAFRAGLLKKSLAEVASGPRLDKCIERYVETKKPPEFSKSTYRLTRDYLEHLERFCDNRAVFYIRDLSVDLIEDFKATGLPAGHDSSSIAEATKKVRAFLREAYRREWIMKPLAERIRSHFVEPREQSDPFEPEQIECILARSLKAGRFGYARYPQTFRLLLELMLKTGLRVSDAVLYNPRKTCKDENNMWVYTYIPCKFKKRNQTHDVYLSDRLKLAIDECGWCSTAMPFVYDGRSFEQLGVAVYNRMQWIGKKCEIADCRPHRLRDTFACRLLSKGRQFDDVSRLLGHRSVKITEMYYAKWVPARAVRLSRLVADFVGDS